MSLERRPQTSSQYYYQHHRIQGETRKLYVGSTRSLLTKVMMYRDRHYKARFSECRERIAAEQNLCRVIAKSTATSLSHIRLCFRIWMMVNGYRYKKKEWKRMNTIKMATENAQSPLEVPSEITWEELERLRISAHQGCHESMTKLREVVQANPDLWKEAGDLHACTEDALLDMIALEEPFARKAIFEHNKETRRQLQAESGGTALETLLINHAVLTEMQVLIAQMGQAGKLPKKGRKSDLKFWNGRYDTAQRQFMEAVEMLKEVRRVNDEINRDRDVVNDN